MPLLLLLLMMMAAASASAASASSTACSAPSATPRSSASRACRKRRDARCVCVCACAALFAREQALRNLRVGVCRRACVRGLLTSTTTKTHHQTPPPPPYTTTITNHQPTSPPVPTHKTQILAKAEFLNPGGSVKDRVALEIVREAVAEGRLRVPGGLIAEGTAGSTGISLAMVARALGCRCFIALPDDVAEEKAQTLAALGAEVCRLRPVSIAHPDHPVNVARRRAAAEGPGAVFADQFENLANMRAHLRTGDEIWRQAGGSVDAFVSGAGTGGTIAGVSAALKRRDSKVKVFLVDPPGSSLYNRVTRGVLYAREEAEGARLRHPFDTVTEGIGLNRLTANFAAAGVDGAFKGSDREAVEMAAHLLR